jgi:DNA-binding XRE family transcriptional regulator
MQTHLSRALVDLRGNRSQREIADMIGISRVTLANIELGRTRPSLRCWAALRAALDVPPELAAELEAHWTSAGPASAGTSAAPSADAGPRLGDR